MSGKTPGRKPATTAGVDLYDAVLAAGSTGAFTRRYGLDAYPLVQRFVAHPAYDAEIWRGQAAGRSGSWRGGCDPGSYPAGRRPIRRTGWLRRAGGLPGAPPAGPRPAGQPAARTLEPIWACLWKATEAALVRSAGAKTPGGDRAPGRDQAVPGRPVEDGRCGRTPARRDQLSVRRRQVASERGDPGGHETAVPGGGRTRR